MKDKKTMSYQTKSQVFYRDGMLAENRKLHTLCHDIHNHWMYLDILLSQNDIKGARKYLQSIAEATVSETILFDTNNFALDAILSEKTAFARTKNIAVETEIYLMQELNITEFAWCTLMANALDNAIEACEKIKGEKSIFIGIKNRGNNLAIMIKNSCETVYHIEDETIPSTKMKAGKHGIGIKSMRKVVNDYNGILKMESSEGEFRLKILLCGV